jgi:thymidylate synthase (FAD)
MKAELIDCMGDDLRVVNAARVSFDKESSWDFVHDLSTGWDEEKLSEADQKLIRYLAKHDHFSPFTHCTITLRETVPIFVARQRFKHTVGFSYNEVSRRYVDSEPEFFKPEVWRARAPSLKQGSLDEPIDWNKRYVDEITIDRVHDTCLAAYYQLLDLNVCPEQARMVLPQSMMTSYYVTGSLMAFARAYKLRADGHAQKEIRDLAAQWDQIIRPLFPVSWSALCD